MMPAAQGAPPLPAEISASTAAAPCGIVVPSGPRELPSRKIVFLWALVVAALSQVPNWLARTEVEPGAVFIGSLAPFPEDVTYHLSFVEQARRGAVLFEDKYNGDRVRTRMIVNAYFLVLGLGASLSHLALTDAALVARFVVAVFLLLSVYSFAARWLDGMTERALFMILAPFGSGLGWMPAWGLSRPFESLDLWAVEVSTFRAMADDMVAPVTTALLLWVLVLVDRALARPARGPAFAAGVAALVLGMVHPHDLLVTVYVVATSVALLRAVCPKLRVASRGSEPRPRFDATYGRSLLWIVACSTPILVYDACALWREPLFWSYVTIDDAFRPHAVAAGFGIPLGLAILGAYRALRRAPARFLVLGTWLGAATTLLFVPVPPCRQFFLLHGVQVGLSVLAALVLAEAWHRTRSWTVGSRAPMRLRVAAARFGLAALLAGACLTTLVHVQQWFSLLRTRPADRFVPADLSRSLRWLELHAAPSSTLLAAESASRLAPALAGLRVLAAQDQQTVDYAHWRDVVASLLTEKDAAILSSSLERHGIHFVLVGPEEERIGGPGLRRRLESLPCLRRVFTDRSIDLYEYSASPP
jgi:hypothetical protein